MHFATQPSKPTVELGTELDAKGIHPADENIERSDQGHAHRGQ